ncbi:DUF885 domain-containing protein [Endozoicomonas sp. G2_1]|uniref:DUF885 domain-containing protein n=1 Tax=Endozoicomonas sp. G2_1 TaxID=2821091 RepID=UPI001AD9D788|nr:DUF885 domain-containing protein [Endozoicomonas sp. G2_1]MBO9490335.1 DUF885 domain-containing protein [Endozoicomonas sp. G2_1]
MKTFALLAVSLLTLSACTSTSNIAQSSNTIELNASQQALTAIIAEYKSINQHYQPLWHSDYQDNNTKLPDLSPATLEQHHQALTAIYNKLMKISASELGEQQQIDLSVLSYRIKNELDQYRFNSHYMPFTAESGFHTGISFLPNQSAFNTEQDYLNYFKRLAALPKYFDQQMYWMKQGLAVGATQPKAVLKGYEQSISAYIKDKPEDSVYFQPLKRLPKHFNDQQKQRLIELAKASIEKNVFPSYQGYYDFMVEQYLPQARNDIAASTLPDGQAFYDNRVKHFTTLDMAAEQVHAIGLEEVKRIRAEMDAIIKQTGFTGSFAEFVHFLRTDPQFYATTPEQLLKEASFIAKKMDAKLPSLFKTLPRNPYGIEPVPANIAPKYTTGRYSSPSRDDQAGSYWVNTYRLDRRPLYVLEALTLHEAVPGHHLQGALTRELENVSEFRNHTYISAFGEGWGLYAEYLGKEAGFYQDAYSEFGRLTYEMWRACRLVVDTGMHVKGWSRQRAMDYLASNTALSLHNVQTEIDRYISWPGQALSYKIGELTIKRLRAQAEQKLGEHFDLRDFHDQILKNGSMPLSMLEKLINQYIEQQYALANQQK